MTVVPWGIPWTDTDTSLANPFWAFSLTVIGPLVLPGFRVTDSGVATIVKSGVGCEAELVPPPHPSIAIMSKANTATTRYSRTNNELGVSCIMSVYARLGDRDLNTALECLMHSKKVRSRSRSDQAPR